MLNILNRNLDHAVLQRDGNQFCRVQIPFTAAEKDAEITVSYAGKGKAEQPAGSVVYADKSGDGSIRLNQLPAGGPYEVAIYENGKLAITIHDLMVGDVWLLAGQSNMLGAGKLREADLPEDSVRCFGFQNSWTIAKAPLHNIYASQMGAYQRVIQADKNESKEKFNGYDLCVGPGHRFALELFKLTGVPQGVIAGAVGAASLEIWDPDHRNGEETNAYYGALLTRFQLAGGNARGLFWYQGEANTRIEQCDSYTVKTSKLLNAFRKDFSHGDFPIVLVQLSKTCADDRSIGYASVREQQRFMQNPEKRIMVIPALDLENLDGVHLTSASAKKVGQRAAYVMYKLLMDDPAAAAYPEPESICSSWDSDIKSPAIKVTFKNLHGDLHAVGNPHGFYLHYQGKASADNICYIELQGNTALLHLIRSEYGSDPSEKYQLSFGGIANPLCNIYDGDGRPLLGFGPLPISKAKELAK